MEKNEEQEKQEEYDEISEENTINILDEKIVHEINIAAERVENETKVNKEDTKSMHGKGKDAERPNDLPKKTKQTSKQNHKAKATIPRPFNLATEKRMSRDRQGSVDFKEFTPVLSRSASLNYKTSNLKNFESFTRTTAKTGPKVRTDEKADKRIQEISMTEDKVHLKEVEKKKPQVAVKKQEGDEMNNKLRKISTFKALPLPSFYHQKDPPPKLETKKVIVTHSKPPLASEEGKAFLKKDSNKNEEKAKRASRTLLGTGAKESMNRLFRSTKSGVRTLKPTLKTVVSKA